MKQIFVLIAGRTNTGKSTLFNKLMGNKIIATSNKINTTQDYHYGSFYFDDCLINIVDTPGILNTSYGHISLSFDLVILLINRGKFNHLEEEIYKKYSNLPIIAVINKVDKLRFFKSKFADEFVHFLNSKNLFKNILFISSKHGHGIYDLKKYIISFAKNNHFLPNFDNNSFIFILKENVKEIVFRHFHKEIPYSINYQVEKSDFSFNIVLQVKKKSHLKIIKKSKIFLQNKLFKRFPKCNFFISIQLSKF